MKRAEQPPGPLLGRLARIPLVLYQLRLGRLLGHRFLVVVHRGRRTGRMYRTVVEVVRWDPVLREAIVASGWGDKASWWRNLQAAPAAEMWLAGDRFVPEQRFLGLNERIEELRRYRHAHPFAARSIGRFLGIGTSDEDLITAAVARLTMVAFRLPEDRRLQPTQFLSADQARSVYNRIGRVQDLQAIYERRATRQLLAVANFGHAKAVFELGYGTGKFADVLLSRHLPADGRYVGADVSPRMRELAAHRLRRHEGRAELYLADGSLRFPLEDGAFDRFVANYVLDLLSPDDIDRVLTEAQRLLASGGLVCLTSLTSGSTAGARVVTRIWRAVWSLRPQLVGGCRPLRLTDRLDESKWVVRHHSVVTSFAVSSEVLVAAKANTATTKEL